MATTTDDKNEFLEKHKLFNVELKEKDVLIEAQKKALEEKNKAIKNLQERIQSLEKRLEAESKFKDDTIKQLKNQLNQQSTQIAHMTFKALTNSQNNKLKSSKDSIENDKTCSSSVSSNSDHQRVPPFVHKQTFFSIHAQKIIKPNNKSNESSLSDASSDKILIQPLPLPLKVFRNKSKLIPPPDHKPFLLATAKIPDETIHNINTEMIVKPKLKSLPPIKTQSTTEINQIAVELPHKTESPLSNIKNN